MKRVFSILALLCAPLAYGQGGVPASPIYFSGPTGRPLAGATVTVCTSAGTGFPCSPLASIFTNAGLSIASPNPVTTDGNGNLPLVFAAPGVYVLSVTGSGITPTLVTATVAGTGGGNVVTSAVNNFTNINTFTNAGVFTGTQMNEYVISLLNGLNPGNELHIDPLYATFFNTEAITGGTAIPAGSAIINGVGVAGYVNSSCDSLGRSKCNGVGGFFRGRDVVNGSAVWGINPAALDMPGLTGHHITGSEIDLGVFGSPTFVRGEVIILGGVQSSYGTMPTDSVGLEIFAASPANLKWNRAIQVDRGASSLGQGLVLEGKLTTNPTVSHSVSFSGYDSGGVAHQASVLADSAGNLSLQPSAGAAMAVLNSGAGLGFPGTTFASLGTPANGTQTFCSDCTIANPCAGAGTGAFAKRLNGVWVCN